MKRLLLGVAACAMVLGLASVQPVSAQSAGADVKGGATSTTGPGLTGSSGGLNCDPSDSGCRGKTGALSNGANPATGADVKGGATSTTGPGLTGSSGGLNCAPSDSGCLGKSGALSGTANGGVNTNIGR
jgi:hypothetical protein